MFKLLRLEFDRLVNFAGKLSLDLSAEDRVVKGGENLFRLSDSLWTQNVIAFVGINASGKTTGVRLLQAALHIIVDHSGLDQLPILNELCLEGSIMDAVFFLDGQLYRLVSEFGRDDEGRLVFRDETIYKKRKTGGKKEDRFLFAEDDAILNRRTLTEDKHSILKDCDSIAIAVSRNAKCTHFSTFEDTSSSPGKAVEPVFLSLLDKSIESISFANGKQLDIKFRGQDERQLKLAPLSGVDQYVSSGTIRAIDLFDMAYDVLCDGGCLIVDEVEMHMNKKLVQFLISLFQDNEVNSKGATLVFTTHYAELVDSIERKDNIYVFLKDSGGKCFATRYCDRVKRNDIKKSDILLSAYIDGTSPSYEELQAVREYMCRKRD